MLLTKSKRNEYLKILGFKNVKELQEKYFKNKKDIDGIYGKNTDILLRNAYNVYKYCKNFELEEFKCHCGKYCTGYPHILDTNLLKNIQMVRNKYGAIKITSPLRCKTYNSKLPGSSSTSRHMSGKALDISNVKTKSLLGRKEIINYWFTLLKPNYGYCDGFYKYGKSNGKRVSPNMGSSVHIDVK